MKLQLCRHVSPQSGINTHKNTTFTSQQQRKHSSSSSNGNNNLILQPYSRIKQHNDRIMHKQLEQMLRSSNLRHSKSTFMWQPRYTTQQTLYCLQHLAYMCKQRQPQPQFQTLLKWKCPALSTLKQSKLLPNPSKKITRFHNNTVTTDKICCTYITSVTIIKTNNYDDDNGNNNNNNKNNVRASAIYSKKKFRAVNEEEIHDSVMTKTTVRCRSQSKYKH